MSKESEFQALVQLAEHDEGKILSVYVEVDQSHAINLNRGFETIFKTTVNALKREIDDKKFHAAVEVASARLRDFSPAGKTLVMFLDSSGEVLWENALSVPLGTSAHWRDAAYLKPLMAAQDEFERFAVVLVDRRRARVFTVFMNEATEYDCKLATGFVDRPDAVPRDMMQSSDAIQDMADENVDKHLDRVAERLEDLTRESVFDRIVLGGAAEAAKLLEDKLRPMARERLRGYVPLPVESTTNEIHAATRAFMHDVERKAERALVENVINLAGQGGRGTIDTDETLLAAQKGRIDMLIYSKNMDGTAHKCTACGTLSRVSRTQCAYCQGDVVHVDDLVEELVHAVLRGNGQVEEVEGDAADLLNGSSDGIAATLRYATT